MSLKIGIVAGESSGDRLGGGLLKEIRARFPDAEFRGIGGPLMIEQGLESSVPMDRLSRMGLVEVLRHLPELLGIRRSLRDALLAWKPDVFIGVDAPDFNLGLEKHLKKAGIPTVHYVSPTIWAWRPKRVVRLRAAVDRVLCIFPFEPQILAEANVDGRFVGHPLARQIPLQPNRQAACERLAIDAGKRWLALLPGSRRSEVKSLGKVFLETAALLVQRHADMGVIMPVANPGVRGELLRICAQNSIPFEPVVVDGRSTDVLMACDVALTASGTATLEAMLCKRPMVVAYRLSALTYQILTRFNLIKTEHIAQPNILAGEALVPEFIQGQVKPASMAQALERALHDQTYRANLEQKFVQIHRQLDRDADKEAACVVLDLIGKPC